MNAEETRKLEERIAVYENVIASFEGNRQRMLNRRKGATDSVMVRIDESLQLNERTLKSLKSILSAAKRQLSDDVAKRT